MVVNGDTTVEPNETFSVTLTSASGAVIGRGGSRPTILNDDPASGLRASVSNADMVEGNEAATTGGSNPLRFHVSLSTPVPAGHASIVVKYTVTGLTATGGAGAGPGIDFTQVSTPVALTFSPGQQDKTVGVNVFPDTVGEPDERFSVNLVGVSGGATLVNATARRAVVTVPNSTTQTVHVQAINDAGAGNPSNNSTTFTPTATTLNVTTQYNSADNTRLLKNATYFAQNAADAQRTSVGILGYLVGIAHPPAITPIEPPVNTGPNDHTTPWSTTDQSALVTVMRHYALTPSEAQYFSVQLIGYLLALAGN